MMDCLGKEPSPQEGGLGKQRLIFLDEQINLGFCITMRDCSFSFGDSVAIRKCAPDKMIQAFCCSRGFGEVDTLSIFNLHCYFRSRSCKRFKKVCEGKDYIGILNSVSFELNDLYR
jgi:hypothetical protein